MSDIPLLVDAQWLSRHPEVRVVDLRWAAAGPPARQKYDSGHIPGAFFMDLDRDLSHKSGPGRHPFPSVESFAAVLGRAGIGPSTHVVVYDDTGGTVATRLWFMLHVHGLPKVSILDGGLKAWTEAGLPLETAEPRIEPVAPPPLTLDRSRALDVEQVLARGDAALIDVRAPERYRGEVEPIDRKAGHIPGAFNAPFAANLTPAGRFRPPGELYELYNSYVSPIVSCGSGVTACHAAFAIELGGLPPARLYVGSFSGWIEDPSRPVATGAAPG